MRGGKVLSSYGLEIGFWIGKGGRSGFWNLGSSGNLGTGFSKKGFDCSAAGMGFFTVKGFGTGLITGIGFVIDLTTGICLTMRIGFCVGLYTGIGISFTTRISYGIGLTTGMGFGKCSLNFASSLEIDLSIWTDLLIDLTMEISFGIGLYTRIGICLKTGIGFGIGLIGCV